MKKIWMPVAAFFLLSWSVLAYLDVYYRDFSFQSTFVRSSFVILLSFMIVIIIRYFGLLVFSYLNYIFPHVPEPTPEMTSFPLVTVIIPAFNESKNIEVSLKSVLAIDYPNMEIFLMDDGSTDGTADIAAPYAGVHPNGTVTIVSDRNKGKPAVLNRGVALSTGEFILCMDADAVLAPNVIRLMLPHFMDPKVGAVAGNIKVSNRDNMLCRLQALEYVAGQNTVRRAQSFFDIVNVIPGTLGVFRRSAMLEAGGYDHDTFAEDTDLTIKLLDLGWKVQCAPDAFAWTESPEDVTGIMRQRYRWTRGILQTVLKHQNMLWRPDIRGAALWLLAFESVVWPPMNMFAYFFFVFVASTQHVMHPIILWWIQLSLLDMVTALHCVAMDNEWLVLVPYSVIFRFYFVIIIDVGKVFSIMEEFMGIQMRWDQIARKGKAALTVKRS